MSAAPSATRAQSAGADALRRAPAGSSARACRACDSRRRARRSGDAASPRPRRCPCGRARKPSRSAVETCRTWIGAPVSRAIRTSRASQDSAASRVAPHRMARRIAARGAGRLAGVSRPRPRQWKAARRRSFARMPRGSPASSGTSRLPVEEPMKTLIAGGAGQPFELAEYRRHSPPCRRSRRRWSQCMRPRRAGELVRQRRRRWWSADRCWASRTPP